MIEEKIATLTENILKQPILEIPSVKIDITLSEIIIVFVVFSIAYLIYFGLKIFMAVQVKREKIRKAQSRTLLQLAGYIITISSIAFAFSSVGYSLTYLLVGSTALLVGLGFGLQQLLVDLISGIIILIDKNINYGDVVRVDIPGVPDSINGKVIQIGVRTTLLETIDNEIMIVPNSKLLSNGLRSLMRNRGAARFRVQIQVAYDTDMEKAKEVILKVLKNDKNVEVDPEPTIIIRDFLESGVKLELRFWMTELWRSENNISDIRFALLDAFLKNGIHIPLPQRVIHEGKDPLSVSNKEDITKEENIKSDLKKDFKGF